MENWKDIKGFEDLYQISDIGRIKNNNGKLLKCFYKNNDLNSYLRIGLTKNKKQKKYSVHRLVAETFIKNPNKKPLINHINGVKNDNRVSNLEWCTAKESIQHSYKNNLQGRPYFWKYVKCLETNEIFDSSYKAALWLNNYRFNNKKKISTLSRGIRKAMEIKKKYQDFSWEFYQKPSTTSRKTYTQVSGNG